jgi:hypothetical protein
MKPSKVTFQLERKALLEEEEEVVVVVVAVEEVLVPV